MQKIIHFINTILLSIILFNTSFIQSMKLSYGQDWLQKHEYTVAQAKLLENKIKDFMRLSIVCKHYNKSLTYEAISNFCQNYNQETKNMLLQQLIWQQNYYKTRLPALILISAGADDHSTMWGKDTPYGYFFFYNAVHYNDTQFVATLLKHGTSPDVKIGNDPLFFSAKTLEIAQLFIDYGVNIHANGTNDNSINVLWTTLFDEYPSEIMALYIKNNADVLLCRWDKFCLLHAISAKVPFIKNNGNNLLKKAKLLLDAIPNMINATNKNGITPLDIAQETLNVKFSNGKRDKVTGEYIEYTIPEVTETAQKLFTLFQEHGALTAKEIIQQEK